MSEPTTVELKVYGEAPRRCGECGGSGEILATVVFGVVYRKLTCPACGGTGEVYGG